MGHELRVELLDERSLLIGQIPPLTEVIGEVEELEGGTFVALDQLPLTAV